MKGKRHTPYQIIAKLREVAGRLSPRRDELCLSRRWTLWAPD